MNIQALKTRKFLPPIDKYEDLINYITPNLKENMVVAITSKVIAICQGRCIAKTQISRENLIQQESQLYLNKSSDQINNSIFTIINNVIISAAGIDESNGSDFYILLPKNPSASAKKIWKDLKKQTGLKALGVVITDSHSTPLRRGATGISIGFYGFEPLKDYRNKKDLFGRKFRFEVANFPDALASAAVLEMGEGDEQTPICLISNLPVSFKFISHDYKYKDLKFYIDIKDDIFSPFFKPLPWKKGGSF